MSAGSVVSTTFLVCLAHIIGEQACARSIGPGRLATLATIPSPVLTHWSPPSNPRLHPAGADVLMEGGSVPLARHVLRTTT